MQEFQFHCTDRETSGGPGKEKKKRPSSKDNTNKSFPSQFSQSQSEGGEVNSECDPNSSATSVCSNSQSPYRKTRGQSVLLQHAHIYIRQQRR